MKTLYIQINWLLFHIISTFVTQGDVEGLHYIHILNVEVHILFAFYPNQLVNLHYEDLQCICNPTISSTIHQFWMGAQWLSGRVLDSRLKGRRVQPQRRHCIVSLSKNTNPYLVLVQSRKTCLIITERLLMGLKESNQTKTSTFVHHISNM